MLTATTAMVLPTESGLLRLAIAKGLLRWEDLDSVADHLPPSHGSGEGAPGEGRWVRALVEAGFLEPRMVEELAEELQGTVDDLTPDLTGGGPPFRPAAPGASASPASRFPPELRFLEGWARYRVDHLLGSGGMGTVCKAFDPTLGRWVALKFLHRNGAPQTERFLREARAQARVDHPNVCQVHEVGEVEGRPYISMQLIDGRSLGELTEELSLEDKVRLLRDVARAIHAAHRTGLIHRDLKPGNILLARKESGGLHPYVVDFGLAMEQDEVSLSRTGMISGTPAYISPEQAQGRPLDRRTDVYSLGVVLYELIAGVPPFRGGNLARILVQVVQEDAKPLRAVVPAVPEDLETIVAKCLEKDPARRYESARALAEDLDCFLEDEPIRARPAGWTYRAGKRLRKNRALTAVSVAALVAFAVLGGLSLRAQWQAREKTELAQRFGQRIGEIQASLRYEATLPRHDITPHKRRLLKEMESVRAEMHRLGAIAEGPGSAALGQAYLALHQYGAARGHLERAWKSGVRGPDVAAALGQTLGFFYQRSQSDATLQGVSDNAKAGLKEADRAYRQPALAYLREAAAAPESSPYLAALIAYYEKRYPQALAEARRAYRETPWLYEAAEIEAEVYLAQGSEAGNAGRYEEALSLYDRAGGVYARLIRNTPSDPGLYVGDCNRWARSINAASNLEDVPEARVTEALAACERALSVDPQMSDVRVLQASIFWRLGDQKFKRGDDPSGDLQSGIRLAERAIALDPSNGGSWSYLASLHRLLAQWKLGRGLDARADILRGIEAASKAVEIEPGLALARSGLGNACLVLVQDQQRRGVDPVPTLKRATASYQKAFELNPEFLPASIGLGNAWKSMSEIQVARGADPSDSVGKAVAAFERAAHLNPSTAPIYNNLGNVHLTLGEYLLDRGSDPRDALTRAARSYQRAIEIKPDYSLARYNLGYTWRSLAEALLEQGQDPGAALKSTEAVLAEALRLNPNDADVFLERARAEVIAARWSLGRRQDPSAAFRKAQEELAQAEVLNPEQPDVFFTQAEVARYQIGDQVGDAALRKGLERVGRALAINPGEPRYLALQGLFRYRTAQGEADPDRRREGAQQAAAALEKALKANPLLAKDYEDVLKEARLEAGLMRPRPLNL